MDLSTTYLGLHLKSPLMPGASPMVDSLDTVKRLEDAGASAIVMHSLFEEQIVGEEFGTIYHMEMYANSYAEALSYFPGSDKYALGPEQYLKQIQKIKDTVSVPVIASLNGTTPGGWAKYARLIEEAGADALELNVYYLATDPGESGERVEQRLFDVVEEVRKVVKLPLAVKLSPFFSSIPHVCSKLQDLGAEGIVIFNRFYQPDIDAEGLQAVPQLYLSDSSELLLRLRWTAILRAHLQASIGLSGGVHTAKDAIKGVMAGAHAIQVCSALLKYGPDYLRRMREDMVEWMEKNEYHSLRQMQGSLSLLHCPDPAAFERANYMRVLQSWRPERLGSGA